MLGEPLEKTELVGEFFGIDRIVVRRVDRDADRAALSHREAIAAAARALALRVLDLKRRADHVLDVVDLRALEQLERRFVDEHGGAVALDHEVARAPGVVESEIVLKARTA